MQLSSQNLEHQLINSSFSIKLENPFHPLDLSAHDLLTIYKRFEQSCEINHNAKHQLPIEIITQLICTLKACKPSYIQKCMAQSLIKSTISWSDFLMFLDQQSQVREQILLWLMHEKSLIKYHLSQKFPNFPIRSKIQKRYEYISYLRTIHENVSQNQKLMLLTFDNRSIILLQISIIDSTLQLQELDRYIKKNDNSITDLLKNQPEIDQSIRNDNAQNIVFDKKSKKRKCSANNRNLKKNNTRTNLSNQRELNLLQVSQGSQLQNNNSIMLKTSEVMNSQSFEDEQTYLKKDRKNIQSLFNLFCQVPIQQSVKVAKIAVNRISQRNINPALINNLRQQYINYTEQQHQEKHQSIFPTSLRPLQKARNHLALLYRQKKILSYNPHKKIRDNFHVHKQPSVIKKINYERKEKQYLVECMQQIYCQQLSSLAIIYYNMDLVILKIVKEYNKILLEQQTMINLEKKNDRNINYNNRNNLNYIGKNKQKKNQIKNQIQTKIGSIQKNNNFDKRDHKKNQIVQTIQFYYHSIVDRWFVIVLFRNQQTRKQSCLRGYQLSLIQNKRRFDNNYKFKNSHETFTLLLDKKQMISMKVQKKYGFHMISQDGKYICYKEQYIQQQQGIQNIYWKFQCQEKFKGHNLSLCCLAVGNYINKLLFGTIKGIIVIYDMFSRNFQMRKISTAQILQVQVQKNQGFILTSDEKLHIYEMQRGEKIQVINVRNENKLHQKVRSIFLDKQQLFCYGTQIKVYEQHLDQNLLHQNRKMQNMYTWRLKKLNKQSSIMPTQQQELNIERQQKKKNNQILKQQQNCKKQQIINPKNVQFRKQIQYEILMLINSQSYLILLSQILEVLFICRKNLRVKFTIILAIPYDSRVMKMDISSDEKLLIILLLNQHIYIFNIHTQDLYLHLQPQNPYKLTNTTFLDHKNEYLIAIGTQSGKILLVPCRSVSDKKYKILHYHYKSITITLVKQDYFLTAGQDGRIGIWQLPFNILKYQISCPDINNFIIEQVGFFFNSFCIFKTITGNLIQLNIKKGSIKLINDFAKNYLFQVTDQINGKLIGLEKDHQAKYVKNYQNYTLEIINKKQTYIKQKQKIKFSTKYGNVIGIGIVLNQKVVIFFQKCAIGIWNYSNNNNNNSLKKISIIKI